MDPHAHEIRGPDGVVRLESKSIQVLRHLVAHHGKVCSRQQILDAVWTDQFVGEEVLTRCIWDLRRALTDSARQPRFIQTVPKAGYRLLTEPKFPGAQEPAAVDAESQSSTPQIATPTEATNTALTSTQARRQRRDLLILARKVERFWIDSVLGSALPAEPLSISYVEQPDAVESGWGNFATAITLREPNSETLSEAFEASGEALLVLGEAGAGKTTELLQLAKTHLELARADPAEPIPVVLHLATWRPNVSLSHWVIAEVNQRYQIPHQVAKAWLQHGDFSLFLDGMDEMPERHRAAWIQACNTFRQELGLVPILVTCRSSDYAAATQQANERLKLGNAVHLQPLSRAQSLQFLAREITVPAELRTALRDDPELERLARSPLMLSLLSRTYSGKGCTSNEGSSAAESGQLWSAYVDSMLSKPGSSSEGNAHTPTPVDARQTLRWLARSMKAQQQTVVEPALLQPTWLQSTRERVAYLLLSRGGVGLFVGAMAVLFTFVRRQDLQLAGYLLTGTVLGGFLMAIMDGVRGILEHRASARRPPSQLAKRHPLLALYPWLVWICTGATGVIVVRWSGDLVAASRYFFLAGLPFCLLLGVNGRRRPMTEDVASVETIRWSWSQALRGLTIGAVAGFVGTALLALSYQRGNLPSDTTLFGPGPSVTVGMITAVLFGLRGRRVEAHERSQLNTRIRNSVWGAGLLALSLMGAYWALEQTPWMLSGPDPSTLKDRRFGLSLYVATIALLWFGGLDLLKQFCLRLVLSVSRGVPLRLKPSMDFFVSRALLRPVGTGYVFRHRQLLEHLASQQPRERDL